MHAHAKKHDDIFAFFAPLREKFFEFQGRLWSISDIELPGFSMAFAFDSLQAVISLRGDRGFRVQLDDLHQRVPGG